MKICALQGEKKFEAEVAVTHNNEIIAEREPE
jgi:hypothetical protein